MIGFRKADLFPQQSPQTVSDPDYKVVIAVDGPAASGKGTFARKLAHRLGYAYLDTGALYRAVGLATLELGGDPADFHDVEPALQIVKRNLTAELLSNPALRSEAVSDAASKVAALPEVRIDLLDYQRQFAQNPPGKIGGAVLDGRDIGTIICPKADVKFFITASVEERAKRRFEEVKSRYADLTLEQVLEDLRARDARDTQRKIAPAVPADDAYVLDTTTLSPNEALEEGIAVIRSQFLLKTEQV